jgi:hypothetical protein
MGKTIMGAVVSLDGYIANIDGEVGSLFDWYGNGDMEWKFTEKEEQPFRTTKASRDFMRAVYPHTGAMGPGDAVTLANPSRVVQGDRVTHLLYDVEGATPQDQA